jgi:hypothetical protein
MGFQQRDLTGSLCRNDRKAKPTDADYAGSVQIGGYSYWVNGWVKTSAKSGKRYLSLSLRPKQVAEEQRHQIEDSIDF